MSLGCANSLSAVSPPQVPIEVIKYVDREVIKVVEKEVIKHLALGKAQI